MKLSWVVSLAETANRADLGQLQFWSKPSEILNLRSSNTAETVAFNIPWYQTFDTPKVHTFTIAKSFYSVKYGSSNILSNILSNIFFILWVSRCFFFQRICNIGIFYSVLVLIKEKKICRRSKYLLSTVEYLAEYLMIQIWRSRKTLLEEYITQLKIISTLTIKINAFDSLIIWNSLNCKGVGGNKKTCVFNLIMKVSSFFANSDKD